MRIKRIHVAGLAALVGVAGAAGEAAADDLTITTATTAPVSTATAANSSPGDVTVNSGGSITLNTAGQTAVTVNSSNDVTFASGSTIQSTGANNTGGIRINGGFTGDISNAGAIAFGEDYTMVDSDNDGDLDGPYAQGSGRFGILMAGAHTGNITNTGTISIEGNNSSAIRLDALLTGNLTSSGGVTVVGDNSVGVWLGGGAAGGVTGNVSLTGGATARGQNAIGFLSDAPITGSLTLGGSWTTTGYHSASLPADVTHLDADDLLQAGPTVAIHFSVGGGVTVAGIGVEDDLDDDNDGIDDVGDDADPNDDANAAINSISGAPALLIQADPSANLTFGPIATGVNAGLGLQILGSVSASGVYEGVDATGLRIEGSAGTTANMSGGIGLDNVFSVTANEATATGVYIGNNAIVPLIRQRRILTVITGADGAENAYGFFIAAGANAPTFTNTGRVITQFFGEVGNSYALVDQSNTLTTINNSGQITAQVIPTDDNLTDNIPPPPVTGSSVAIDVSASTVNVTLNQTADVPFTDQDTVDDDSTIRPAVKIEGDIRFGAGNDTVNLLAGTITGALSFGAGADVFNVNNGATYAGRLTDSDGALTLNVVNGTLDLDGGVTNLTAATFGSSSNLQLVLSSTPGESTVLNASGTVTFNAGAHLSAVIPEALPTNGSVTFLTAGSLVGAGNVTGALSGSGSSYIYNTTISQVGNSLQAGFALKTPGQLGLNTNQSLAFNPIIEALRTDSTAAAAMANIDNAYDFNNAYEDLVPSYSAETAELAATAIQQMQSAATNRLTQTRLHDIHDVSVWGQEIGYGLTRTPESLNSQEFRGQGFGLAAGIDGPLDNGGIFGLSLSFVTSEAEEPGRPQGEIAANFGQANAYLGTAMGPIDLDFVAGLGAGRMHQRRFVQIGSTFSARTDSDWWAFEGHGAARASMPLKAGWFTMTPQAALSYIGISEQDYEEDGGGTAIDLQADGVFSQRLWADVGVDFATTFRLRGDARIQPHIYGGYRANVLDDAAERTFRYVSTGTQFTLQDDSTGDGGALVGIGVDGTNGYSTFSISYEGEFGDQIERHSLNASLRFRF